MKTILTRIGRRQFVLRSTLATAGAAFAPGALGQMMGGGGMGGGGGVIDPPVGALLQEPVLAANASTVPGVVDVSIEARVAAATVNGVPASLLTYDGSFIAPTIRANPGDVIYLRFRNALPFTTESNM